MRFLKELLVGKADEDLAEAETPTAHSRLEAALDRAIEQRQAALSPGVSPAAERELRSGEDRRQGTGIRPDGLPDRRLGPDRRSERRAGPVEFGRRR